MRTIATRVVAAAAMGLAVTAMSEMAAAACSCTNLKVNHANQGAVTICSDKDLNFPECQRQDGNAGGCNGNTYAYTCPTGVNNAAGEEQQVGFGIDATLTGDSDECESGQVLQLTMTSDDAVDEPTVHATPGGDVTIGNYTVSIDNTASDLYPDVGATTGQGNTPYYGADSYTDPNADDLLISRSADHIMWWDNTDQAKDSAGENATWKYRFFSYVKGSDGQQGCGCVFDIDVDWPGNGNAATTWTAGAGSSHNCTF